MERPSNSIQNDEPFRLEELEARVLLSADGLSGVVDDGAVSTLGSNGFESAIEVVQDEETNVDEGSLDDDSFNWSEGVSDDFLLVPEGEFETDSDSSEEGDIGSDNSDEQVTLASESNDESASKDTEFDEENSPGDLPVYPVSEEIQGSDLVLTTNSFEGESAATTQMVETLNAANAPPISEPIDLLSSDLVPQSIDSIETEGLYAISPLPENDLLVIDTSSVLSGNGAFVGDVISSGEIRPGNSPGIFDVVGDLELTPGSLLVIELGGLQPGPNASPSIDLEPVPLPANDDGFDQVNVTGALQLGGTLQVDLINSFVPTIGQSFEVLTFGELSGAFDSFVGQDLGNNLMLMPSVGTNSVVLKVMPVLNPLVPFVTSGTAADVVLTATTGIDEFTLSPDGAGGLQLDGPLMIAPFVFPIPTNSLTIDGGDGFDEISTAGTISLPDVALTLQGESLAISFGSALHTGSGDIFLNALANDGLVHLGSLDGLFAATGSINVGGGITTTGDLSVTALVSR
ncbi:LEPR-XLL domain-containing protein [bacterium]|nr:LEPR-XLL domain-containing protein [bacterium]